MDGYKSTTVNFYQEDVSRSFDGALNAHLPMPTWQFRLWNKESCNFDWKGTLEELIKVILAGQTMLAQQKRLLEIAQVGQS